MFFSLNCKSQFVLQPENTDREDNLYRLVMSQRLKKKKSPADQEHKGEVDVRDTIKSL
jgi:hypothetical protein